MSGSETKSKLLSWLPVILRSIAFVGIGLTTSIAVAWGCSIWSYMPEGNLDDLLSIDGESDPGAFDASSRTWDQGRPTHFPARPELITPYKRGFGVGLTELVAWSGPYPTLEEVENTPEDELEWPRSYEQSVITAGLPIPCMQVSVWDEVGTEGDEFVEFDRIAGGFAIGGSLDELHLLPLTPLPWGMLVGAVFWGGLAYLLFAQTIRIARRLRSGPMQRPIAMSQASATAAVLAVSLLAWGCDDNQRAQYGTAQPKRQLSGAQLQHAALGGDVQLVRRCLEAGVDANGGEHTGGAATPLACAVMGKHESIVELLLRAGADPEAPADALGRTPLMLASSNGDVIATRLLIETGASVNTADEEGVTALMCAAASNSVACIEILLEAGADVHAAASPKWGNGTALDFAGNKEHFEAMEALVGAGARIPNGASLLHIAAALQQANVVDRYVARGDDVNARDINGMTPLHYDAASNSMPVEAVETGGDIKLVGVEAAVAKLLLDGGADANARDKLGQTPLHHAAITFHEDRIRRLIAAGADPSIRTEGGLTAAEVFQRAWESNPIPTRASARDRLASQLTYHTQLALLEGRDADAVALAILESQGRVLQPPSLELKAVLSGADGTKVLIREQVGRWASEDRMVGDDDIIELSGLKWKVADIDQRARSMVVMHVSSGLTHVIAVGP